MAEKDKLFLDHLSHLLVQLHKEYHSASFEELEKKLLDEAKEKSINLDLATKMEFLGLVKEIIHAYQFAAEKHKDQKRASGEPYIIHPLQVALNEIYHQRYEKGAYAESPIIAALLHDTVEDTPTSFQEINEKFGHRLENIVKNLTIKPEWKSWKEAGQLDPDEKAALQFVNARRDPASMEIKYDDRMHNLETLKHMDEPHRVKKLIETMSVGFIDHAVDLKRFDFLIQLYICLKTYLTEDIIRKYSEDPDHLIDLFHTSSEKIQRILKEHQHELFHHTS